MTKALLVLIYAGIVAIPAQSRPPAPQVRTAPTEAAAIKQFEAAIADYLAMRRQVAEKSPGLAPNSTSVELNKASDALAAAIEQSRPNAAVGDLFVAPITAVFKRKIDEAIGTAKLREALAAIDDEEPHDPGAEDSPALSERVADGHHAGVAAQSLSHPAEGAGVPHRWPQSGPPRCRRGDDPRLHSELDPQIARSTRGSSPSAPSRSLRADAVPFRDASLKVCSTSTRRS